MLAENFWKIIFIALVGTGCWFWWKAGAAKKTHERQIGALAELMDTTPEGRPKSEAEATQRMFQILSLLGDIRFRQGDDFKVEQVVTEANDLIDTSNDVSNLLLLVVERNYTAADRLGLLDDDDALFRMSEGAPPKIPEGFWKGQSAEIGYYIPPSVEPSLTKVLLNRILVPESVLGTLAAGEVTKTVKDWAEKLKRANILDLAIYDSIISEYNILRKQASRRT